MLGSYAHLHPFRTENVVESELSVNQLISGVRSSHRDSSNKSNQLNTRYDNPKSRLEFNDDSDKSQGYLEIKQDGIIVRTSNQKSHKTSSDDQESICLQLRKNSRTMLSDDQDL